MNPRRERPDAPLGTLIFRAGLLPAETIESALEEGVKTGKRLGEILTERDLISEVDLARLLAGQKGFEFVTLGEQVVDPTAAALFTEEQALLLRALPYAFDGDVPVVAIADPADEVLIGRIREALGREDARLVVTTRSELAAVAADVYSRPLTTPPVAPEPDLPIHEAPSNGSGPAEPATEAEHVSFDPAYDPEPFSGPEPVREDETVNGWKPVADEESVNGWKHIGEEETVDELQAVDEPEPTHDPEPVFAPRLDWSFASERELLAEAHPVGPVPEPQDELEPLAASAPEPEPGPANDDEPHSFHVPALDEPEAVAAVEPDTPAGDEPHSFHVPALDEPDPEPEHANEDEPHGFHVPVLDEPEAVAAVEPGPEPEPADEDEPHSFHAPVLDEPDPQPEPEHANDDESHSFHVPVLDEREPEHANEDEPHSFHVPVLDEPDAPVEDEPAGEPEAASADEPPTAGPYALSEPPAFAFEPAPEAPSEPPAQSEEPLTAESFDPGEPDVPEQTPPQAEPPATVDPAPASEPIPLHHPDLPHSPAAVTPEPERVPLPETPAPTPWRLTIRLDNGERVDAGEFSDEDSAKHEARAIMSQVGGDQDDWPFVDGRFLKPDTIVSVDIAEDAGGGDS